MALSTVSFTSSFDLQLGLFVLTDTTDFAGQGVSLSDVLGNFKITDPNGTVIWNNTNYSQETGTAQSGGVGSITLAVGASATDDFYKDLYIIITGGTGVGQKVLVTGYDGSTKVALATFGVAPDATSTYEFSFSDIVPEASLVNQGIINLSLSSTGLPIAGTYTIVYSVKNIITGAYVTSTGTFTFSFITPTIVLTNTVNCFAPQLIGTDATNYVVNGVTPTVTRTHTLYYPPSLGLAPITGTATDISTSSFFTPATFEHTLSVNLDYDFGTYHVLLTLTGQQFINVTCDAQLCDAYCCISSLYNNYKTNLGVNNILAEQYLIKITKVTSLMTLIQNAYACGQSSNVSSYVSDILRIADCQPGCGCSDSTPHPVVGVGLGNGGITLVDTCGNGITVTSNVVGDTTTYTVCLSQSIINKINSIGSSVVLGTVSNTVTAVTVGSVTTYTVQGAAVDVLSDLQLPQTTSLDVTQTGTPATLYEVRYIGRNYKLLHSFINSPAVPTTNITQQVISTYTMPASVITAAGDKIRVQAHFKLMNTSLLSQISIARLWVGGMGATLIAQNGIDWNLAVSPYSVNTGLIMNVEITRITDTSARLYFAIKVVKPNTGNPNWDTPVYEIINDSIISIPSFAAPQDWVATIQDSSGAGRTQLLFHTIEFIPKV